MKDHEAASDRRLDWALDERLGGAGDADRDLAAAVLARHRAGEATAIADELAAAAPPSRAHTLAAAALMLFGLGVVVAVALLTRGEKRGAAPTQAPVPLQDPAPTPAVRVTTRKEIEALPADTRAVIAESVDDDDLQALLRLRELTDLEVRNQDALVVGLGLKTTPPAVRRSITVRSFGTVAQLTKLRRLALRGTFGLNAGFPMGGSGPGPEAIADASLGQLERLPLLTELSLAYVDTPDYVLAVLPKLRSLQKLDLEANHGVGADGLVVIAQCRTLRSLSLRFCQQLQGKDLARLGELPELRELDVGGLDGMNWRNNLVEQVNPMRRVGSGVNDAALASIAKAAKLERLDISGAHATRRGLAELERVQSLRELNLFGLQVTDAGLVDDLPAGLTSLSVCADLQDDFCARVRARMKALRHLDVSACTKITDAGIGELVAMPSLRELEMRQMYGLTRGVLAHLQKAVQLEALDVRINDFLLVGDVRTLRASLPKLKTLVSAFSDAEIERDEERNPEQVSSAAQAANLPAGLRSIRGTRLLDDDVEALVRFRDLRLLDLTTMEATEVREGAISLHWESRPGCTVTDRALRAIGQLSKLRTLRLSGNHGIEGPGLAELAKCPLLETLDLSCFDLDDDALVEISRLQQVRDLDLAWNHGFGERGLRALSQMRGLRRLSLHGCSQLHDGWLAGLAVLDQLRELDVGGIDGQHWRLVDAPPTQRQQEFLRRAQALARDPDTGLGDAAMAAIGKLRQLVVLDADEGRYGASALVAAVAAMPQLESLSLRGCALPVEAAARLPGTLRVLVASGPEPFDDAFLIALAQHCRELVRIELDGNQQVTDAGIEALAKLPHLQWVIVPRCPKLTAATVRSLLNCPELGYVDLRGETWMTKELADELKAKVKSLRSVDFDAK